MAPSILFGPSIMRARALFRSFSGGMLYLVFITAAWAATSYADFLHALALRESSMNPNVVNDSGYVGLFQMGEAAMIDAGYYKGDGTKTNNWSGTFTGKSGINSLADFKNNPDVQVQAIVDYEAAQMRVIQILGLTSYIGKTINGVEITQSGLVAGAHLVGYGALQQYLKTDGSKNIEDGNGTPISEYIQQFGGYTVGGSAPSYAAVRAAAGGFGVTTGPKTSTPGTGNPTLGASTGLPIPPAPLGASADDAFFKNTGYQFDDVSNTIKMFIAASLFLWLAWTLQGNWRVYCAGKIQFIQFKTDIVRSLVVLIVGLVLLS